MPFHCLAEGRNCYPHVGREQGVFALKLLRRHLSGGKTSRILRTRLAFVALQFFKADYPCFHARRLIQKRYQVKKPCIWHHVINI